LAAARETYDNRDRLSRKHTPGTRQARSRPTPVFYTHDRHGEVVELTAGELQVRTAEARSQLALALDVRRG